MIPYTAAPLMTTAHGAIVVLIVQAGGAVASVREVEDAGHERDEEHG